MSLHSVNPATGEVLRTVVSLSAEALQGRIDQAAAVAPLHRDLPIAQRAFYLNRLSQLLQTDAEEIALLIALETGKPLRWSRLEVERCASLCLYCADHLQRLLAPESLPSHASQAYLQWNPLGIVLALTPAESPLWLAMRVAIPALAAGNLVLLQVDAAAPQCALAIESFVRRAGFERATLTTLLVERDSFEAALKDTRIDAVSVTGHIRTGRAIAAQAGWLLKPAFMHFYSSDAMIVMPSANMEDAVAAAAQALTGSEGPCAAKRIIVHSSIASDFAAALVQRVESLKVGDPAKEETDIGPLHTGEAQAILADQVDAAVTSGGRVLTGGAAMVAGKGHFFEPTLLSDVPHTAAVVHDALIGPAAMLFRARDLREALNMANDSPHGAAACVWTLEPAEQQALLHGVDAGTVTLNALQGFDPALPVGGSKRSGYGAELGQLGVRQFLQRKTVVLGSTKA